MDSSCVHRRDVCEDVYEDDKTTANIDYHRHNHRHDVYGTTNGETQLTNGVDAKGRTGAAPKGK